MPRKKATKFIIPELDQMRADVGATPNKLAGAAGCSLATTQAALRQEPRSKNVCERLISALRTLNHATAHHGLIVAVAE